MVREKSTVSIKKDRKVNTIERNEDVRHKKFCKDKTRKGDTP